MNIIKCTAIRTKKKKRTRNSLQIRLMSKRFKAFSTTKTTPSSNSGKSTQFPFCSKKQS